jgi:hypothetical protein
MTSGRIRSSIHCLVPQAWTLRLAADAAAITAVGIAGCSGDDHESGPATFQPDTFPFTFQYPEGFEFRDDVSAKLRFPARSIGRLTTGRMDGLVVCPSLSRAVQGDAR